MELWFRWPVDHREAGPSLNCVIYIYVPKTLRFHGQSNREFNKVTIFLSEQWQWHSEKENLPAEMEGVASRLSRASSRYSGPSAAAVFNGRVRKWKKKWVRVSTSSVGVFRASKPSGRSNSQHHLLLHKWTPLSSATAVTDSGETEEPPKRRFRYAPVSFPKLEKKNLF